ncbi:hypothetical protein FG05_35092 [Fusarium graminearum]|nr:hypothetical protein FG05_35092 [Fusarium graminearum]
MDRSMAEVVERVFYSCELRLTWNRRKPRIRPAITFVNKLALGL